MADYAAIDQKITLWAQRHRLVLQAGEGARFVYVSSIVGECFQIWIEPPSGVIALHAASVETRDNREVRHDWAVVAENFDEALEGAFQLVLQWMAPSERYFPA